MRIKDGFVKSQVGGQHVVVPIGEMSVERHCMIRLNGTGSFIWDCLQSPMSIEDIVSALCGRYDVGESEARADVEDFLGILREADLLVD